MTDKDTILHIANLVRGNPNTAATLLWFAWKQSRNPETWKAVDEFIQMAVRDAEEDS